MASESGGGKNVPLETQLPGNSCQVSLTDLPPHVPQDSLILRTSGSAPFCQDNSFPPGK